MSQFKSEVSRVTRSKQQAAISYDRISSWYDLLAGTFESKHNDAAIRKLSAIEGDNILEIGYGTGHAIEALVKAVGKSGKVYGIDLSEGMRKITKSRLKKAGFIEKAVLECGDAVRLPFNSDYFDKILVCFTLELFDTPEIPIVLSECLRTLRAGGRICIVAMSKKGKPTPVSRFYEWLHEKLPNYIDCRPIYVQKSLEEAGFCILDATNLFMLGLRGELVLAEKKSD